MIHNEILDKEKNIFFTFSYGEMSCMADASRTIENNKKYQNIRYIAKDANRSFLTVYVFIINFNVNDNKGNEKKKFIVTFIAVCRYLLRKSCVRGFFKIFPCSLNRFFNFSYIRFYIFRCFFQ